MKKTQAIIGGTVLSGLVLSASLTAYTRRKKKAKEHRVKTNREHMLLSMAFDVVELREALLRSYAAGIKLRDSNEKMREFIVNISDENTPVLLEIGEFPEPDPFVVSVVEKETTFDGQDLCSVFCDVGDECMGVVCPLFIQLD